MIGTVHHMGLLVVTCARPVVPRPACSAASSRCSIFLPECEQLPLCCVYVGHEAFGDANVGIPCDSLALNGISWISQKVAPNFEWDFLDMGMAQKTGTKMEPW